MHTKMMEEQNMKTFSQSELLGKLKGWGKLGISLTMIYIFIFHIGPWLEKSSVLRPIAQFIEERDINANMYFYTEVEEFSEANINMENTMDYPPRP